MRARRAATCGGSLLLPLQVLARLLRVSRSVVVPHAPLTGLLVFDVAALGLLLAVRKPQRPRTHVHAHVVGPGVRALPVLRVADPRAVHAAFVVLTLRFELTVLVPALPRTLFLVAREAALELLVLAVVPLRPHAILLTAHVRALGVLDSLHRVVSPEARLLIEQEIAFLA